MLHMSKTGPGRAPPYNPGDDGALRPAITLRPAPAALPHPVPTVPLEHPTCGSHLHETSSGVRLRLLTPGWLAPLRDREAAAPRRSSPRLPPRMGQGLLRLLPWTPHPQLLAAHAKAETGQRALAQVIRLRPQPDLQQRLPLELCTITPHAIRSGLHDDQLDPVRDKPAHQRQDLASSRADLFYPLRPPPALPGRWQPVHMSAFDFAMSIPATRSYRSWYSSSPQLRGNPPRPRMTHPSASCH
jgi:hypothetical protein